MQIDSEMTKNVSEEAKRCPAKMPLIKMKI